MRLTLTITRKTPIHIHLDVHINHGRSGSLILRNEEFEQFCEIMKPDKIYDNKPLTKTI